MAHERITKTPGICGGDACIRGTRIQVWLLVGYRFGLKRNDKHILKNYPQLSQEDLNAAWDYYRDYKNEVDLAYTQNDMIVNWSSL